MQKVFHRLMALLEYKKEYQLSSSGLHYHQLHVLEEVYKTESIKTLDISKALNIPPSTLIGILDTLEKKSLVLRERSLEDKRVVTVRATEKGCAVVKQHIEEDKSFLQNLFASLTDQERQRFFVLLGKALSSIQEPERLFEQGRLE